MEQRKTLEPNHIELASSMSGAALKERDPKAANFLETQVGIPNRRVFEKPFDHGGIVRFDAFKSWFVLASNNMLGVPTISPSKPARKKPKLLAPKSARRDGKFTKIRASKPSFSAPIEPEPAGELARRAAEARRAYFGETSKPICPLNEYNLDDNGFDDNFGNDWSQYD